LFEIYAELLIQNLDNLEKMNDKIQSLLSKPKNQIDLIEYYQKIFNALKLIKNLDQNLVNDFKILLEQSNLFENYLRTLFKNNNFKYSYFKLKTHPNRRIKLLKSIFKTIIIHLFVII
jgi:hypothetical protein